MYYDLVMHLDDVRAAFRQEKIEDDHFSLCVEKERPKTEAQEISRFCFQSKAVDEHSIYTKSM